MRKYNPSSHGSQKLVTLTVCLGQRFLDGEHARDPESLVYFLRQKFGCERGVSPEMPIAKWRKERHRGQAKKTRMVCIGIVDSLASLWQHSKRRSRVGNLDSYRAGSIIPNTVYEGSLMIKKLAVLVVLCTAHFGYYCETHAHGQGASQPTAKPSPTSTGTFNCSEKTSALERSS